MEIGKLSALKVKNAKLGYHGDGGGLWLQIRSVTAKSWVFRYSLAVPGKEKRKQYELGIGSIHTVSLTDARIKAREFRLMLQNGQNPKDVRKTKAMTFDQCAAEFIKSKRGEWKNAKHAGQWETTLASYASPVIGSMSVGAVDTEAVMRVLNPIWTTKTETANRLRGRIESILDWAKANKLREGDNPAAWRGHLSNLLPSPKKIAKPVHHPALAWRHMSGFMADLRSREGIAARAVEFAIFTAARSGEVRGATWSEIQGDVWVIPADRMKAGREHHVPLSSAAQALLKAMPKIGDLIFPGGEGQLSDMSLTAVLRRMGWKDGDRTITVHGFRSTFRMWSAEATSFPRDVCEHALAHNLPDKVEAAYQRSTLFEKRKLLMQSWGEYCQKQQATITRINKNA
jgi:integrase